jgi:MarR family transcriptional regulator, transcriptional regulator for hemolysin
MIWGEFLMTRISEAQRRREGSFGFLVQTLARRIDATMKERLTEHGVDFKVFANLMALAEEDGINQRQLGAKLDFPEYYTSRNVDALVKAGFAERRPDPNSRRSSLVFLTKEGRKKTSEMPQLIRQVNEMYLAEMTEDERTQVVALLQKVVSKSEATGTR